MVRSWRATLVVAAMLAVGCPSENNDTGGNNVIPNAGNGSNDPDMEMPEDTGGDDDADNVMNPPDMGGGDMPLDFAVGAEGPMHGDWEVRRGGDDVLLATLRVRHSAGETSLVGTYTMQEPVVASGRLGGTTWLESTFTTSWTVRVDNTNEQFGLTQCTQDGENAELLNCRYNNSIDADVIDATLVRP